MMNIHAAQMLADYSGFTLEVYEGYGAPGGPTTALQGEDRGDFNSALASFLRDVATGDQDYEDCGEIADAVENLRTDRLGTGWVWY